MNFGELLERSYRAIHDDLVDGVATGGSATSIVDSFLSGKHQANKFKNWIAFISRTSDGLSPQNRFAYITAYANTGTATIETVTDAVAAGDEYSFVKGSIPLHTMKKLCNDAIQGLDRIPLVDTSLTLDASTIRYTLPIAIKGRRPDLVYFRHPTTYTRYPAPNYEVEPGASGSPSTLVFRKQTPFNSGTSNQVFGSLDGYQIVVWYEGIHEALTAYNSPVSESIPAPLAVAACVYEAMKWKVRPRQRKIDVQNEAAAKRALEEAKVLFPIERPTPDEIKLPIGIFNR